MQKKAESRAEEFKNFGEEKSSGGFAKKFDQKAREPGLSFGKGGFSKNFAQNRENK